MVLDDIPDRGQGVQDILVVIQDQDPGLIPLVEAVGVDMEEEAGELAHPAAEEVTGNF